MIQNATAWIAIATTVVLAGAAHANTDAEKDAAVAGVPMGDLGDRDLADVLQRRLPDINIAAIESSPIPGMRTVEIDQGVLLHVTEDGSYAIAGVLYALTDDGPVDPFEARKTAKRMALLADVPMEQMIVFAPEGETRAVLSVFTDTDCGFCRKLHAEVPELNGKGIEVRYLAFPRMGIGSETYDKMVSAWCADNRHDAITRLKRGRTIPSKSCDNPVAEQYEIGQLFGIQGTPTIITGDGELIRGYVPAAELAQGLGVQ